MALTTVTPNQGFVTVGTPIVLTGTGVSAPATVIVGSQKLG